MRLIALFLTVTLVYAGSFPKTFSSAGDEIYASMQKYIQIKDLDIYADRPELLEAFCKDANETMQKGFALDRIQEDPEQPVDKALIKSYAKELRVLSKKNESISNQVERDIKALYAGGDFKSLKQISQAGFYLNDEIQRGIKDADEQAEIAKMASVLNQGAKRRKIPAVEESKVLPKPRIKQKEAEPRLKEKEPRLKEKEAKKAEVIKKEVLAPKIALKTEKIKEVPTINVPVEQALPPVQVDKLEALPEPGTQVKKPEPTELEYYQASLAHLKDELYVLRESDDQTQMACLNDVTAMNYWMIRVLESEKDPCAFRDAIVQMKSYDKASASSCGRDSMRYIEWHGRIRPYVGRRLFQAEADCRR